MCHWIRVQACPGSAQGLFPDACQAEEVGAKEPESKLNVDSAVERMPCCEEAF